jgi:C-terminal processing protease CtpA/Prc
MKNSLRLSLALPLAIATPLIGGTALAQGSGKAVTVFRMAGPQLGVRLEEVDKDVVTRLKLKEEKGALVVEVVDNSAAAKAGIRKDDVIVRFQGESILTAAQLSRLVKEVPSGRKVDIDVVRGGAPVKVTATLERGEFSGNEFSPDMKVWDKEFGDRLGKQFENLGDMKLKAFKGENFPKDFNFKLQEGGPNFMTFARASKGRLGITFTEIDGQLADYFKAPKDSAILVDSVIDGSAAAKAGIKAGDLLIKLGGTSIVEGSDLQEAVRDLEPGKATPATVWRDGRNVELSVTIEDSPKTKETLRRFKPVS